MKILKFSSKNFRNAVSVDFSPSKGVNILIGENGQGKTNILEALYLLTGEKSFRGASTIDLIRYGQNEASVNVSFFSEEREQTAKMLFLRNEKEKKAVFLNGIKKDTPSALSGKLCMVVFSPENLTVIKAGPDERRKLIDTAISQITPSYQSLILSYNKTLFQRNALLKDINYRPASRAMLPVWDERLASVGARIIRLRERYCTRISPFVSRHYEGLSGGKEEIRISYICGIRKISSDLFEKESTEEIKKAFISSLEANTVKDIELGSTSVGPHRDDLLIEIDEKNARFFASQGQQRSAVLSLKLAEAELLKNKYNESPILLLDDVLSELDRKRQEYIIGLIGDSQVFITCCEWHESIKGRIFRVENGKLKRNYTRRAEKNE